MPMTRDRRSHAPPPMTPQPSRTGRKRWCRPDVARPEPMTRLDVLAELPAAGRQDVLAATLAGNAPVAL